MRAWRGLGQQGEEDATKLSNSHFPRYCAVFVQLIIVLLTFSLTICQPRLINVSRRKIISQYRNLKTADQCILYTDCFVVLFLYSEQFLLFSSIFGPILALTVTALASSERHHRDGVPARRQWGVPAQVLAFYSTPSPS